MGPVLLRADGPREQPARAAAALAQPVVAVAQQAAVQGEAAAADAVGEAVAQPDELVDARVELVAPRGGQAGPVLPVGGSVAKASLTTRNGMPTRWATRITATRRSVSLE
jgi:hypothetical protein